MGDVILSLHFSENFGFTRFPHFFSGFPHPIRIVREAYAPPAKFPRPYAAARPRSKDPKLATS